VLHRFLPTLAPNNPKFELIINMNKLFVLGILVAGILSVAYFFSCTTKGQCDNVVCLNSGACYDGKCVCPVGYEGAICDTLSRDKFVYNFNGGDSCGVNLYAGYYPKTYTQYPIHIRRRLYSNLEILIQDMLNFPNDSAVGTMLKTDSFSFIGSNNATSYTGSGWLRHDTLWMQYHVVHDTISYDCSYMGLKY
jgi:hypothetical protein